MIRYRCPHCAALIVAHERRAGQSSVCKACVKPHPIPADPALWLNERGDPVSIAPPPVVAPEPPSIPTEPIAVPEPVAIAEPVPPSSTEPEPEPISPSIVAIQPGASVSDFELPDLPLVVELLPVEVPREEPSARPLPPVVTVQEPEPESVRAAEPPVVVTVEREPDVTPLPQPAVVTIAPPPVAPARPLPVPVTAHDSGRFVPSVVPVAPAPNRADPVQLQTQADIAAALTAALTSRMKPAETPRRDLRPSTAAWMLLTALGGTLTVLALFTDADYRWPLLAVGVIQIVAGYVWIVRLTQFRDPTRGVLCAVPPLTLYYLAQYKYAKLRPLRFVLTGAVLVALAGATPALVPHTRALVNRDAGPKPLDPAATSKLAQLRAARGQRAYDSLSRQLEVLAKTDPTLSADAKDRAELSAELKALCGHSDTGVKVRAMVAYATWDPAGARSVCLTALQSPTAEEREWALKLAPQWKDEATAQAVQARIGRSGAGESNRAKAALEEIGGTAAEAGATALLLRAEDQSTKLTALSVLEKVGSAETAGWLRSSYASGATADDPAVRDRALATSDAIKARLRVPVLKGADPRPKS